jgi:hypothetical protein
MGIQMLLYSFFNLGARWKWVVNVTLWPPYPREKDRYQLSLIKVKNKVNFTPEQATQAQRGSRGIALLFL